MTTIKSEKGATLVEFVLVLPLLVMFLFAIIEFSVMMFDKAVVGLGSREGARAAIVWRPDTSFLNVADVRAEVDQFLGVVGGGAPTRLISFGDKTTALENNHVIGWSANKDDPLPWSNVFDPDVDEYVRVYVEYRYDFLVLKALSFIGLPDFITLKGTTIMRMENPS